MTVASGFLFGTLLGAACSVAGATLGAIAVFLVARTALGDLLRHRTGSALARMRAGFQENALNYLLVLRLVPLFPSWLVNLVPAFLGVSLKVFVIGTLLGIIRSEEHTSELQSLMRISYAVFCLKKKTT